MRVYSLYCSYYDGNEKINEYVHIFQAIQIQAVLRIMDKYNANGGYYITKEGYDARWVRTQGV